MVTYVVNYTDESADPVSIGEKEIDHSLPIALFGRRRLEYGEEMNENILHLLENFACPEDEHFPGTPDLELALDNTLANAIDGQLWYNSTQEVLYMRTGEVWIPLSHLGEVASNFGTVAHGEAIPIPVSETGYVFSIAECDWLVSPRNYTDETAGMICSTDIVDDEIIVNHTYNVVGGGTNDGIVNYMIIGIRASLPQAPDVSATPLPSITPTVSLTETPTITPTPPVTPPASGGGNPDPEIIWSGADINNPLSSTGYIGNLLTFRSDAGGGPSGQANMEYWNGTSLYEGWIDRTPVLDGEFMIKVELDPEAPVDPLLADGYGNMVIQSATDGPKVFGDVFDANYAQIVIDNGDLTPGQTVTAAMIISISGVVGGVSDENWVDRYVTISVSKI